MIPFLNAFPGTSCRRATALALGFWLSACGGGDGAKAAAPGGPGAAGGPPGGAKKGPGEFPVEVQPVAQRDVTYSVRATGSVEAYERVQVTARVAGVVDKVNFMEGDVVPNGATLVEIDAARYRIAVVQAKATLQRAKASVDEAQTGLARREAANKELPGTVRDDELEQYRSRVALGSADMALAQAQLDQAEVNLRDANVRALAGGMIESRSVSTGQYVQAGTVLATLLRREPLLLRFEMPEEEAARVRAGQKVTFDARGGARPYRATVFHVSESADEKTRLVTVRARVDDPDRRSLRAGTFAQVKVPVGAAKATVIPQTSVRPSEFGFLGFVVKENVASQRVMTLGMRTEDGLVEVMGGVEAGELIVTRGAEALKEGSKVKVVAPAQATPTREPGIEAPPLAPGEKAPGKGPRRTDGAAR